MLWYICLYVVCVLVYLFVCSMCSGIYVVCSMCSGISVVCSMCSGIYVVCSMCSGISVVFPYFIISSSHLASNKHSCLNLIDIQVGPTI